MKLELKDQYPHTMKTLKILVALMAALFVNIYTSGDSMAKGSDSSTPENQTTLDEINLLTEDLEQTKPVLAVKNKVEIYNSDNRLIAFGIPEDDRIMKFVGISDLLTETGNTKLYRLSYE